MCSVVALSAWVSFMCHASGPAVSAAPDKRVTIQIGSEATWLDRHAAEELARYAGLMTGHAPVIVASDDPTSTRADFLIGARQSNALINALHDEGLLGHGRAPAGRDAFTVRSVDVGGRVAVALSGENDRSTLYAVYDYLEEECGAGFFPDGEYLPTLESLPTRDIQREEASRFTYRWYLRWNRPVMKKYTARWHTWEELKQTIDWEAKRKFNVRDSGAITSEGPGMGGIIEEVFDLPPEPEELCAVHGDWWYVNWFLPPARIESRQEKALEYARKLGFANSIWVPYGAVPRRYKQNHPEHVYVPGDHSSLSPKDPAATEFTKEILRRTIRRFGTDHFYSMNPYGERAPGKDPLELKTDASLNTAHLLRELDPSPELVWRTDAWDYMINPGGIWNEETVKSYLEAMPNFLYIAENTFDLLEETLYEKYNHFHGKKWALAPVHDLGGDDQLHGDLADVLGKAQEVVGSPKGDNCIGFHLVPENANCSIMFWHCVSRLAWNPKGWSLDSLIQDFCAHRYGERSAENMGKYWSVVVAGMRYARKEDLRRDDFLNRPIYQVALRFAGDFLKAQFPRRLDIAQNTASTFDETIAFALKEWDSQEGNALYENDLIDYLRTCIGKFSDFYFIQAIAAIERGDGNEYQRHRMKCIELLGLSARLMSTRPDYSLSHTIRAVIDVPGANRYTETALKMSQFGQGYDTFDNYEQMVFCYIPMVEYILDWYEGKYPGEPLAVGPHAAENPVKGTWLTSPLDPPQEWKFAGPPRQAVRFVIDELADAVEEIARVDTENS